MKFQNKLYLSSDRPNLNWDLFGTEMPRTFCVSIFAPGLGVSQATHLVLMVSLDNRQVAHSQLPDGFLNWEPHVVLVFEEVSAPGFGVSHATHFIFEESFDMRQVPHSQFPEGFLKAAPQEDRGFADVTSTSSSLLLSGPVSFLESFFGIPKEKGESLGTFSEAGNKVFSGAGAVAPDGPTPGRGVSQAIHLLASELLRIKHVSHSQPFLICFNNPRVGAGSFGEVTVMGCLSDVFFELSPKNKFRMIEYYRRLRKPEQSCIIRVYKN